MKIRNEDMADVSTASIQRLTTPALELNEAHIPGDGLTSTLMYRLNLGGRNAPEGGLTVNMMASSGTGAGQAIFGHGTFHATSNIYDYGITVAGVAVTTQAFTIVVPAGTMTVDFSVTAVRDGIAEGAETFSITVLPGDGYEVGTSLTLTIPANSI